MQCDVVVVGGGPSGLATAFRLKVAALEKGMDLSIFLIEKAWRIGGHTLSGALFSTTTLSDLIPDWQIKNPPPMQPVKEEKFFYLTKNHAVSLPVPAMMRHYGHQIVSLGLLCRWLARQAEEVGVTIFPGFSAVQILFEKDRVTGVSIGEKGRASDGTLKRHFQPQQPLHAKVTVLAEGCRGYLAESVIRKLRLHAESAPQTYSLGIKELWETSPSSLPRSDPGLVLHSTGWPLDGKMYGGGFLYRPTASRLALGQTIGLNYSDPLFDPFESFQKWKEHPIIQRELRNARRIAYGARTLVSGGIQSLPKLIFDGGVLVGDCAGFLNSATLKGVDNAMISGMTAANAIVNAFEKNDFSEKSLSRYSETLNRTPMMNNLVAARNIRAGFQKGGALLGLLNAAWESLFSRGSLWTLSHDSRTDRECLVPLTHHQTAPSTPSVHSHRVDSLQTSGIRYQENQPTHIRIINPELPLGPILKRYANPETRYCPAGVFACVENDAFRVTSSNCLHCKTCDIKDPLNNIRWTPPEGGDGPDYAEM